MLLFICIMWLLISYYNALLIAIYHVIREELHDSSTNLYITDHSPMKAHIFNFFQFNYFIFGLIAKRKSY